MAPSALAPASTTGFTVGMPPIRDHALAFDDEGTAQDDDDMPPLVDNPAPSMTFTFFTDMTPTLSSHSSDVVPHDAATSSHLPHATTSSQNQRISHVDEPVASSSALTLSPTSPSSRVSHGKKRDASYIPRPPNAFILFRSSFIRSQQVSGKVEGNHSNLSKIIGKYWRALPQSERDEWEAKAVIAQAEHRKRYPDWRFRPGANAMAKQKAIDKKSKANQQTEMGQSKRRRTQAKDPPDGGGGRPDAVSDEGAVDVRKRKTRVAANSNGIPGVQREKERELEDARCEKIADLLVEGKKGAELEAAVEEWEGSHRKKKGKKVVERVHEPLSQPSATDVSPAKTRTRNPPASTAQPPFPKVLAAPLKETHNSDTPDMHPHAVSSSSSGTEVSRSSPHIRSHSMYSPLSRDMPPPSRSPSIPQLSRSPSIYSPHSPRIYAPQSPETRMQISTNEYQHLSATSSPTLDETHTLHYPYTQASRPRSRPQRHANSQDGVDTSKNQESRPLLARGIPLTQMFKRSLSAPASRHRLDYPLSPLLRSVQLEELNSTFNSGRPYSLIRGNQPEGFGEVRSNEEPPLQHHDTTLSTVGVDRSTSFSSHTHARIEGPNQSPPYSQLAEHDDGQSSLRRPSNATLSPPAMTWQEVEDQRRLESAQTHGYWWNGTETEEQENEDKDAVFEPSVGTEGMGYDVGSTASFDSSYTESYSGSGPYAPQDGSSWANIPGVQGLITVIEDPFIRRKSRSRSTTPPGKAIPPPITTSSPPLSAALQSPDGREIVIRPYFEQGHPITLVTHHHHQGPVSPAGHLPQSSFSTLAGWDGEPVSPATRQNIKAWGMNIGEDRGRGRYREERRVMFDLGDDEGYVPGLGMAGHGGVDRGTGLLYDDDDLEDGMVLGSPMNLA